MTEPHKKCKAEHVVPAKRDTSHSSATVWLDAERVYQAIDLILTPAERSMVTGLKITSVRDGQGSMIYYPPEQANRLTVVFQ